MRDDDGFGVDLGGVDVPGVDCLTVDLLRATDVSGTSRQHVLRTGGGKRHPGTRRTDPNSGAHAPGDDRDPLRSGLGRTPTELADATRAIGE